MASVAAGVPLQQRRVGDVADLDHADRGLDPQVGGDAHRLAGGRGRRSRGTADPRLAAMRSAQVAIVLEPCERAVAPCRSTSARRVAAVGLEQLGRACRAGSSGSSRQNRPPSARGPAAAAPSSRAPARRSAGPARSSGSSAPRPAPAPPAPGTVPPRPSPGGPADAVAREHVALVQHRAAAAPSGDVHQPHRLGLAAAARPGDAGHRHRELAARPGEGTRHHLARGRLADRTMRRQRRLAHAQHLDLGPVVVDHVAAIDDRRGAGDLGQAAGDQAAGAGLGRGQPARRSARPRPASSLGQPRAGRRETALKSSAPQRHADHGLGGDALAAAGEAQALAGRGLDADLVRRQAQDLGQCAPPSPPGAARSSAARRRSPGRRSRSARRVAPAGSPHGAGTRAESASRQRGSLGGKCVPMSPAPIVPRIASVIAWKATSASEWPASPGSCGTAHPAQDRAAGPARRHARRSPGRCASAWPRPAAARPALRSSGRVSFRFLSSPATQATRRPAAAAIAVSSV